MKYFKPDLNFSENTIPEYHSDEIVFNFLTPQNPSETWNVAYVLPTKQGNTLVLNYAPKKHRVELSDASEIEALWRKYPFLKDHKKWESKKALVNSFVIGAVITIGTIALGYFFLLPWLGGVIASKIPMEYEVKLGESLYEQSISEYEVLKDKSAYLNEFVKHIDFSTKYPIQVTVVKSDQINAFALPGGHVVVFSGLLDKMENYSELVALLSHEVSHIHYQHSLKSIAREFSGQLFLFMLFGSDSFIIDATHQLTGLSYSRSLEQEADEKGFEVMKKNQVDANGMLMLFERLQTTEEGVSVPQLLSTHPLTDERIEEAKKMIEANVYQPKTDTILISIFGKL
jgi:predicted Zn-dependent protease